MLRHCSVGLLESSVVEGLVLIGILGCDLGHGYGAVERKKDATSYRKSEMQQIWGGYQN